MVRRAPSATSTGNRPWRAFTATQAGLRWLRCAVLLIGLIAGTNLIADAQASGGEFVVIVHPDNPVRSLARRVLAQIYLKDVGRWEHGESTYPVDLPRSSATRAKFSNSVIGRPVSAVRSYWQQRIFSGRGTPPPELDTDADVVRFVLKHRGAVGYVTPGTELGKAKVVSISGD